MDSLLIDILDIILKKIDNVKNLKLVNTKLSTIVKKYVYDNFVFLNIKNLTGFFREINNITFTNDYMFDDFLY